MAPRTPARLQEPLNSPRDLSTAPRIPAELQEAPNGPRDPSNPQVAPGSPSRPRWVLGAAGGSCRCLNSWTGPTGCAALGREGGREGGKRRVSLKPASYRESSPPAPRRRNTTGEREKPAGLGDPKAGGIGGSEATLGGGGPPPASRFLLRLALGTAAPPRPRAARGGTA